MVMLKQVVLEYTKKKFMVINPPGTSCYQYENNLK